ncbi:MAG: DUF2156 domain-containing protein [Oscillospiraceae bacterium]|nr:DUF2156 domain-containing protein [Oscillospiraceae bacterium]
MSIPFHTPVPGDGSAVRAAAAQCGAMENDAAFASIYLLRGKYGTEIAEENGMILRRYRSGYRAGSFGFPLGLRAHLRDAVCRLAAEAQETGGQLKLTLLNEAQCALLAAEFPDAFSLTAAEEYTEYLYLRENLAQLRGSRYHGKRNHIAQFWRGDPEAMIQPLIAENAQYAAEIARAWLSQREDPEEPSLQAELRCIEEAAAQFDALGMSGLLLYSGGEPIGMTMVSEISPGIWDVHFEKVKPGYPHAWSVVANEMAKCLPDAEYLNREEDLGESGMRRSKQSYQPDLLNLKFNAVLKDGATIC